MPSLKNLPVYAISEKPIDALLADWSDALCIQYGVEPTELIVKPQINPILRPGRNAVTHAADLTNSRGFHEIWSSFDSLWKVASIDHNDFTSMTPLRFFLPPDCL